MCFPKGVLCGGDGNDELRIWCIGLFRIGASAVGGGAVHSCLWVASSGSTAGGIKWVRLGIFAKSALAELQRRIHPNAILPVRFNGRAVSESTISNVMAFLFFYFLIIVLATVVFAATGLDFDVSLGTAVSAMGNMGVTIGQFAPQNNLCLFPRLGEVGGYVCDVDGLWKSSRAPALHESVVEENRLFSRGGLTSPLGSLLFKGMIYE